MMQLNCLDLSQARLGVGMGRERMGYVMTKQDVQNENPRNLGMKMEGII